MMWQQQPTPEELEAQEKAKQEQVEAEKQAAKQEAETKVITAVDYTNVSPSDSLKYVDLQNKLGAFAYSATLPTAKEDGPTVTTDLLTLKFSNKGGFLSEVKLNPFVDYDSIPIYLIKDNNQSFNIEFPTQNNRILNTQDLPFEPNVSNFITNLLFHSLTPTV